MTSTSDTTLRWIAVELLGEARGEKKTPFQILDRWISRRLLLHRLNRTAVVTEAMLYEATPLAKTIAKQRNVPFGDDHSKGRRVGLPPTNWEAGRGRAQVDVVVNQQLARNRRSW